MQPQLEHDASPTPARRGGAPANGLPPDLTAYVLSPKDVVAARSRDWDDRVSWLLQRRRYQDALQLARRQQALTLTLTLTRTLTLTLTPCSSRGESRPQCRPHHVQRVAWRVARRVVIGVV